MLNKLSRLLADAGISLTDHQKTLLVAYVDMLHKWNKAYNLTSVRDPAEMVVRHILDSIVVAPYLQGQRFIDVGTGPGCRVSRWLLFFLTRISPYLTAWASGCVFCVRSSTNLNWKTSRRFKAA